MSGTLYLGLSEGTLYEQCIYIPFVLWLVEMHLQGRNIRMMNM